MNSIRLLLLFVLTSLAPIAQAQTLHWLNWPKELLRPKDDLEIVEINLKIECGEVRSIGNLPSDWNMNIIRPISAVAEVQAEAGHGSSHLRNLVALDQVIGVGGMERSCFRVEARVVSFRSEKNFTLGLDNFVVKPNKAFQPTPSARLN